MGELPTNELIGGLLERWTTSNEVLLDVRRASVWRREGEQGYLNSLRWLLFVIEASDDFYA